MPEIYKYRTQHLRGTKSDWTNVGVNVVPLDGEIVIEKDDSEKCLHRLKIGDGVTPFNDLPYMQGIPVDDEKDVDASLISNALKGNKSGEIVSMTDVSPIEHNVGVKVKSKNHIPFPYYDKSLTRNGISFTVNDDGTILANGTASAFTSFTLFIQSQKPNISLFEVGKTYRISGENGLVIRYNDGGTDDKYIGGTQTFTWQSNYKVNMIYFAIAKDTVFDNKLLMPMVEEGTTVTAYTPYVEDLSAVSVKRYGKNLWDEQVRLGHYSDKTGEPLAIRNVISSENPIQVSALRGKSIYNCGSALLYAYFYDDNGKWISPQKALKIGMSTIVPDNATIMHFNIVSDYGGTYKNDICIALSNGEYEPYTETTYTPNENGIVEGVTSLYPSMTLMTEINSTTGVNQKYNNVYMDLIYNVDINKVTKDVENTIINLEKTTETLQ